MWANKTIGERSPILVLCDAPHFDADRKGQPLTEDQLRFFAAQAMNYGFTKDDFVFVSPCPPIAVEIVKSASKKWKHVEQYQEQTKALIEQFAPRIIVPMGELASRVVLGRAVKITKARGVPVLHNGTPVLPMVSPGYVQRSPDALPAMQADLNTLARIKAADYQINDVEEVETDYRWIFDLDTVRDQIRQVIAVDTETTGLRWHETNVRVLTIQITPRAGASFVCPVDEEYCAKWFPDFPAEARLRLLAQIKAVLEDPSIMKLGFNFKYDHLMLRKLGINVANWVHDGQLMMFCVDENMMRKNLDEGVRIFVPEMAGYADEFSKFIDKSRMIDVPPEDTINEEGDIDQYGMLNYAGGDTDATYRLIRVLQERMKQDKRTQNCYRKIMMPAMLVFANSVERWGIAIDRDALAELEVTLKAYTSQKYRQLVRMAPAAVREQHLDAGKELKFTRPDFTRDILFSQKGFKLQPILFTDSTKDLKDESKKVPSTSKDHLTYFVSHQNKAIAEFCSGLIQLSAAEKMLSTYVGSEEDGSGFHKYMSQIADPVGNHRGDGTIYPSYMLHRTNTGRTASSDPNGQNFPKRSPKGGPDWAKTVSGHLQEPSRLGPRQLRLEPDRTAAGGVDGGRAYHAAALPRGAGHPHHDGPRCRHAGVSGPVAGPEPRRNQTQPLQSKSGEFRTGLRHGGTGLPSLRQDRLRHRSDLEGGRGYS
jgi:DNA polymerase I-like protein with 3'-5' exonuclease and polymerase domains/uracil-DNA glycosylase